MYNSFTEEARKILIAAKEEMKKLKHPYVGSEHLLLSILKDKNEISEKLKEYDLDYKRFKDELIDIVGIGTKESECFLYTPLPVHQPLRRSSILQGLPDLGSAR